MLVTEQSFDKPAEKTLWRVSDVCFLCGQKLDQVPLIMWHGCRSTSGDHEIWLHPECAVHLATCLLMDNHKLKKLSDKSGSIPIEFRQSHDPITD